jgi:hypothetical protein
VLFRLGAGLEAYLGKVTLYQLSYSRGRFYFNCLLTFFFAPLFSTVGDFVATPSS